MGSRRARRGDGGALRHRRHAPRSCARTRAHATRSSRSSSTTRARPTASAKEIEELGTSLMRELERYIVLQVVDIRWREHLENMDYMREGIHLRGDGPEGSRSSSTATRGTSCSTSSDRLIREEVVLPLFHAEVDAPEDADEALQQRGGTAARTATSRYEHGIARRRGGDRGRRRRRDGDRRSRRRRVGLDLDGAASSSREHENIGRNDPCWCGSRQEVQACHGA